MRAIDGISYVPLPLDPRAPGAGLALYVADLEPADVPDDECVTRRASLRAVGNFDTVYKYLASPETGKDR